MSANSHRGEVSVKLADGVGYVLRPDMTAVVAIEAQCGSIIDLSRRALSGGSLSFGEVSAVVLEGMRAHGRETKNSDLIGANLKKVQQLVFDAGLVAVVPAVIAFLSAAVTGGAAPKAGEAEAGTES